MSVIYMRCLVMLDAVPSHFCHVPFPTMSPLSPNQKDNMAASITGETADLEKRPTASSKTIPHTDASLRGETSAGAAFHQNI